MAESLPVDVAANVGERFIGSGRSGRPGRGDRRGPSSPRPLDAAPVDSAVDGWAQVLLHAQSIGRARLLYLLLLKRWIDVALASVALVALSPVLVLIALAVRLDSTGPALFRQTRIGQGGNPFVAYKFRTMRTTQGGPLLYFQDDDGVMRHKIKGDPRVTRVGKVLRRTSLDELPQLINVIRGEMSLVGPRPELPDIVQTYEPWQHRRHLVKPGMTGWWQVQGRSDLPMHEHTELDLYYVENFSIGLDAKVVMRTFRVLFGSGAF